MTRKLLVLISADSFLPGSRAGGPIRALAGLVEAEAPSADMRIITSNRDHGVETPYAGITHNFHTRHRNLAEVTYVDKSRVLSSLASFVRASQREQPDIVYLNSLFSPMFSIALAGLWRTSILRGDLLLIAPRGELGPAARRIKSWKKRPAAVLIRALLKSNRVYWHATSIEEAGNICVFSKADENHVVEQSDSWTTPVRAVVKRFTRPFTIAFVARIVPIKGLHIAIESLLSCNLRIDFHIVGAPEDIDYWERCQNLIAQVSKTVRVYVHGHLESMEVAGILSTVDALVLPTAGENFCHSIAEALGNGVICIIPPTTPWTDIVAEATSSVVARDPASFAEVITRLASLDADAIESQRARTLEVYSNAWRVHQSLTGSLFEAVVNRDRMKQT